jgi:hypothetical protein
MEVRVGDLWVWHSEKRWTVITTNIGWKKDGSNPMGAGVARVAADKFPALPEWYGARCRKYKAETAVCYYEPANFILFPTKPLDLVKPWLSWQQDSDLDLIRRSSIQLAKLADVLEERKLLFSQIALPMVGCLNGNLQPEQVLPILRKYLDSRFVLLERS